MSIVSGVPQGSVLVPLLFSIFITDVPNCIKHGTPHLFADDFQIYYSSNRSEISITVNSFNSDLKCVSYWAKLYGLDLNEAKMHVIVINNIIFLNETATELSTSVKNLGVIFDVNLNFRDHSTYIESKIYSIVDLYVYTIRNK